MTQQAAVPSNQERLTILKSHENQNSWPDAKAVEGLFAEAVRSGLQAFPKTLPFQFFYDEIGSELFEQICRLPEYYLTRTEDAILRAHADAMVGGWPEVPTLIELGSGSAEKTRRLIDASLHIYGQLHYVAIDVSESAIEESTRDLVSRYPSLRVTGVVGDYHDHLADIASSFPGPKLFAFLGSSLGNYEPEDATALLSKVAWAMDPEDRLLLGTDLVKPIEILEAAYDDAMQVTARFNLNILARINRELDGDFDLARFQHRAVYRPDMARVEMHLVSLNRQVVKIPGAGLSVVFDDGETIHTENSHKYTESSLRVLAARSGYVEEGAWSDEKGWFRVQRWRQDSTTTVRESR